MPYPGTFWPELRVIPPVPAYEGYSARKLQSIMVKAHSRHPADREDNKMAQDFDVAKATRILDKAANFKPAGEMSAAAVAALQASPMMGGGAAAAAPTGAVAAGEPVESDEAEENPLIHYVPAEPVFGDDATARAKFAIRRYVAVARY